MESAPSDLMAPSEISNIAVLFNDRSEPNHINPTLRPNEWVCTLGKMQGNIEDNWGGVSAYIDTNQNEWSVSASSPLSARANCARLSAFNGNVPPGASGPERWLSGEFYIWDWGGSCSTFRSYAEVWWGDAATMLTAAYGGFFGAGESVNIWQSNVANGPSQIYNSTCGQDDIATVARSLFVGVPSSNRAARFAGPLGTIGDASVAGEFIADRSTVTMAPVDQAFCYFTSIRGAFAGDGEKAEIFTFEDPNQNNRLFWAMSTTSGQGQLRARARCYLWDQR